MVLLKKVVFIVIAWFLIIGAVFGFYGNNFIVTQNSDVEFEITNISDTNLIYEKYGFVSNYYIQNNKYLLEEENNILTHYPIVYSNDYFVDYTIVDKAFYEHSGQLDFTMYKNIPQIQIPLFYSTTDGTVLIDGNVENCDDVKIEISKQGVSQGEFNTAVSGDTFSKSLTLGTPGIYLAKIIFSNDHGEFAADRLIYYDNVAPEVLVNMKSGDFVSDIVYIKVDVNDNVEIFETGEYSYKIIDGISTQVVMEGIKTTSSDIVKRLSDGDYRLEIIASDLVGNEVIKNIDFTVDSNSDTIAVFKDNILQEKDIYTRNDVLNLKAKNILNLNVMLNGNVISPTISGADSLITLTDIQDGNSVLEIKYNDASTFYIIHKKTSSALSITDLALNNLRTIKKGNEYITAQKEILIEGFSDSDVYINNYKVGKGNFAMYYQLTDGLNEITIKNVDNYGESNLGILDVTYIKPLNDYVSINPEINNVVSGSDLSFMIITTNNYNPLYTYVNGELYSIGLPNDNNQTTISIDNLITGLNYISISNGEKEIFNKIIFSNEVNPSISLLSNEIRGDENLIFVVDSEYGIDVGSLNLNFNSACETNTFDYTSFSIYGKYYILDNEFSEIGNCDYIMSFNDNSGAPMINTGNFNVNSGVSIEKVILNGNEIEYNSGLYYLKPGTYKFIFNEDVVVNNILIDGKPILDYDLGEQYIQFDIVESDFNDKGEFLLSVADYNKVITDFGGVYYSDEYKSNFELNYVYKYLSDDNRYTIVGNINSEIIDMDSFKINNQNNGGVFLGTHFISAIDSISTNLMFEICNYGGDCNNVQIDNVVSGDSTNLEFVDEDNVHYSLIKNNITGYDINNGNLVSISSINNNPYGNLIIDNPLTLVPLNSLYGFNPLEINVLEFSDRSNDLFIENDLDIFYPEYDYVYNGGWLKIFVYENNFKEIILYNSTDSTMTSDITTCGVNCYAFYIDGSGSYNLIIEDLAGNKINDTFYFEQTTMDGLNINDNFITNFQELNNLFNLKKLDEEYEIIINGVSLDIISFPTDIELKSGRNELIVSNSEGEYNKYIIVNNVSLNTESLRYDINQCPLFSNFDFYFDIQTNVPIKSVDFNSQVCSIVDINVDEFGYNYKVKCDYFDLDNIEVKVTTVSDLEYTKSIDLSSCDFDISSLSVLLNSLSSDDMFIVGGIFITMDKEIDVDGNVNVNDSLVKVYINGIEKGRAMLSDNQILFENLNYDDIVNGKDEELIEVYATAETSEQYAESNKLYLTWRKILDTIISVIVG